MNTEKLKEKRKHVEARLLGDRVAGTVCYSHVKQLMKQGLRMKSDHRV